LQKKWLPNRSTPINPMTQLHGKFTKSRVFGSLVFIARLCSANRDLRSRLVCPIYRKSQLA